MGDEQKGHGLSRLDRMEGLMPLLIDDHLRFSDEHNRFLTAQILLTGRMDKLAETMEQLVKSQKELADQQKHTDQRMSALITVVDDRVRKRPQ
jgi:hypothetical protein